MTILNAKDEFYFELGYNQAVSELSKSTLTQQEVQFLTAFLRTLLAIGQDNKEALKANTTQLWEECVPDAVDPNLTKAQFENYSQSRKLYLKVKEIHNTLAGIQGKLKRQMNSSS
jgi:hypothetical protein